MNFIYKNQNFGSKIISGAVAVLMIVQQGSLFTPSIAQASASTSPVCSTTTYTNTYTDADGAVDLSPSIVSGMGSQWVQIPGANWMWGQNEIPVDTGSPVTENFSKTFSVIGTVTSATIQIAVDNDANVKLNGYGLLNLLTEPGDTVSPSETVDINPLSLNSDASNTLTFAITNNSDQPIGDGAPAGFAYKLTVDSCVLASSTPVPPTITLNGANPIVITATSTPFSDPGATATSSVGDALSSIVVTGGNGSTTGTIDPSTVGSTTLIYTVTDTVNHLSASTTREVDIIAATTTPITPVASTTPPTITLNGSNPLSITVGDIFMDPGATATTSNASDTLSTIVVTGGNGSTTGTVDTSAVGSTTLIYTVTDTTNGLSASTTREVDIVAATGGGGGGTGTTTSTSTLPAYTCSATSTETTYVSDASTSVGMANAVPLTYIDGSWTSIPGATWIWNVDGVTDPTTNQTVSFDKMVSVLGTTTSAKIDIAADNDYALSLNSTSLGSDYSHYSFQAVKEYEINPSLFVKGSNDFNFVVTNDGGPGLNQYSNPAGLLYKVTICSDTVSPPTIALIGANPFVIAVGTTFVEPGATASDTTSGDLTSDIEYTGGNGIPSPDVNTSAVGTTTLIYTVTDPTTGLSASTTREVDIVAATSTTPTTPTTPAIVYGSGGGGGGGGGFAFGGYGDASTTATSSTITGALSCPFMTGYVIPGRIANILAGATVNDPGQIEKLQVFLNAYEGDSNVAVTGVLDQATENGIIAFQQKYLNDTMGPWNAQAPSGNVYITTLREINQIVCGPQPSLTPAQQAVINTYLAAVAGANAGAANGTNGSANTSGVTTPSIIGETTGSTTTGTTTSTVGSTVGTASGTPNNALLTGSVVSSGAGNFFGNLFSKIMGFFSGK